MALALYAHPFSSYCQKVLVALYENDTPFQWRMHRVDEKLANVIAYRKRLLARPSFARAVDEARPFRHFFPLGAPDRD